MISIYILELENNKYYVGRTSNPAFRLQSHFTNNGSVFSQLYKPIKVLQLIANCDEYDEDKYTLMYMAKYGIDNVRGGSFCELELDILTKTIINKMIMTASNKCYNCNTIGHYINDCTNNEIKENNLSQQNASQLIQIKLPSLQETIVLKQLTHDTTYFEYESIFTNILNDNKSGTVNIITSFELQSDIYISKYEYIMYLISLLNIKEIVLEYGRNLIDKYTQFIQQYTNKTRIEYDKYIYEVGEDIIRNKLKINNRIMEYDVYFNKSRNKIELTEYMKMRMNNRTKIIIIEIVFCQKAFVSKIILDINDN